MEFNSLYLTSCILILFSFQICIQPVRVEEVQGNHRTMLLGESAKRIASLLRV